MRYFAYLQYAAPRLVAAVGALLLVFVMFCADKAIIGPAQATPTPTAILKPAPSATSKPYPGAPLTSYPVQRIWESQVESEYIFVVGSDMTGVCIKYGGDDLTRPGIYFPVRQWYLLDGGAYADVYWNKNQRTVQIKTHHVPRLLLLDSRCYIRYDDLNWWGDASKVYVREDDDLLDRGEGELAGKVRDFEENTDTR